MVGQGGVGSRGSILYVPFYVWRMCLFVLQFKCMCITDIPFTEYIDVAKFLCSHVGVYHFFVYSERACRCFDFANLVHSVVLEELYGMVLGV